MLIEILPRWVGVMSFKDIANGMFCAFDGVGTAAVQQVAEDIGGVDLRVLTGAVQQIRLSALMVTFGIAEAINENTLPEDTLPSEHLDALIMQAMGLDAGDEVEIDQSVMSILEANIADAMATLGVADKEIADIFSGDVELADAAIESVAETIQANTPDAGDALDELVKAFAFGFEPADMFSESEGFDSMKSKKPTLGGSTVREVNGKKIRYKGVKVVRNGKVVIKNQRLPGQKVVLSAKQKQAMNKLHAKPITGAALAKRMRSNAIGKRNNLYK